MEQNKITPESLESGNVLLYLKQKFFDDSSSENIGPLLACLRDSVMLVPASIAVSKEDMEAFTNAKAGDNVETGSDMHIEPDILENGGKKYFPVFSNREQLPEDYVKDFSVIRIPMTQCIEIAKSYMGLDGFVLDAFTAPMTISFELADIIAKLPPSF